MRSWRVGSRVQGATLVQSHLEDVGGAIQVGCTFGIWVEVQGSGLRVQDSELRVQCSGFKVEILARRVQGAVGHHGAVAPRRSNPGEHLP